MTTNTEALAALSYAEAAKLLADELDYKYQRGIDPHMGEWREAVTLLRRLAAVEAELASTKKALALVQQHHATAWNRGHDAGMRASRDAVKQATDSVKRDAWGNTQLTEALLAVEAERDALQSQVQQMALQALADSTQHVELLAERDALVAALRRARLDINWMLNSRHFLNPEVFDYLDEALKDHP